MYFWSIHSYNNRSFWPKGKFLSFPLAHFSFTFAVVPMEKLPLFQKQKDIKWNIRNSRKLLSLLQYTAIWHYCFRESEDVPFHIECMCCQRTFFPICSPVLLTQKMLEKQVKCLWINDRCYKNCFIWGLLWMILIFL